MRPPVRPQHVTPMAIAVQAQPPELSGLGKALLPTIIGETDDRLVRIQTESPHVAVPIWVATLEEFANTPRFAFAQKLVAERLRKAFSD